MDEERGDSREDVGVVEAGRGWEGRKYITICAIEK